MRNLFGTIARRAAIAGLAPIMATPKHAAINVARICPGRFIKSPFAVAPPAIKPSAASNKPFATRTINSLNSISHSIKSHAVLRRRSAKYTTTNAISGLFGHWRKKTR